MITREFKIVYEETPEDLEIEIEANYIDNGWALQGSPFFGAIEGRGVFCQSVTRTVIRGRKQ